MAEEYDWTRPYTGRGRRRSRSRTTRRTPRRRRKRREAAAAAAACGGCRAPDRTEERALFAQPAAETLKGAQLAVLKGASACFGEGRLERSIQWYEKALVAYDYAFPEDGETQASLDATRRDACWERARLPRSEIVSGGPPELPGNH